MVSTTPLTYPSPIRHRRKPRPRREITIIFEKRNGLSPDTGVPLGASPLVVSASPLQDTEFLDFAKREPRKVARPLLRLAETAELDSAEAAAKGGYGSSSEPLGAAVVVPTGKSEKIAAAQALSTLAAGIASLKSLVNLSAVPALAEAPVVWEPQAPATGTHGNAPKRLTEALRAGWLEGRAQMAHWYAMLLANVSTSKKGQDWPGGVPGELEMLFKEMSDRSRRADMVNAAKNVCLDTEP
eukprot:Skav208546  [mRNA]  locus=scaffold1216:413608:419896:+ [translate_table: standard]